jgi:uncharacterized low-complexity protein
MGMQGKPDTRRNYLGMALGATVAGSVALAPNAEADPFRVADLGAGYQLAEKGSEGKCAGSGEMKGEEGKCGGMKKEGMDKDKGMEGKCAANKDKDMPEGKGSEGKCASA